MLLYGILARTTNKVFIVKLELAQFPVTARSGEWVRSAFIRLAQGVVDAIWLDLGALNKGYVKQLALL